MFKQGNPSKLRHGHTWNGGYSPTYSTWQSMKRRCRPEGRYGKKGIKVCERWQTFDHFLADMGERPTGMTLDRIDNASGYEPSNCRWATVRQQIENRTSQGGRVCGDDCSCGRHRKRELTSEHRSRIAEGQRARWARSRKGVDPESLR